MDGLPDCGIDGRISQLTDAASVSPMSEVTRILSAIDQGGPHAAGQLLPLVYDELRQLAAQKQARETPGQTLQATALVHEAYLRLVGGEKAQLITLRSFGGLTIEEAAAVLRIAHVTAHRYWISARAWLHRQ